MPRTVRAPFVAACALWLLLAACSSSTASRMRQIDLNAPALLPTLPADGEGYPLNPPSAERGEVIYSQKCVNCHGIGGEGDGSRAQQIKSAGKVVSNLLNPALIRGRKPSEWHNVITLGRLENLMPNFNGSLNAQERWDVQAYLWALGTPPEALRDGRRAYADKCAMCHGANGEGGQGAPGFASGRRLAESSLQDDVNRMSIGAPHAALGLDSDQRLALAHVLRGFAYEYADPAALRQARITGSGELRLIATNNTPGGSPIRGLPITLRTLDENGEVFSRTASIDANGVARFRDLPQRSNYFFQAEVDYSGGRFYSEPAQIFTSTAVVSSVLPVYETTTDASGIRINNVLVAVQDVREGEITMVEIYSFDHTGDRAYVGTNGRTLRVSAPQGAKNLRFDGLGLGKRFVQDGALIYDTDVTPPGAPAQRITMIYELPYQSSASLERKVFYPLERWNLILPDTSGLPGTPLAASGPLTDRGLTEQQGTKIRVYEGQAPADTLRFAISGRPLAKEMPGNDTRSVAIALMALAAAIAVCGLLAYRVRAIQAAMRAGKPTRTSLLRSIAALDDAYAAGKIAPNDYARERARLIALLRMLWRA